jgi:uncharacterized membrane protein YozB (DUF420 family)
MKALTALILASLIVSVSIIASTTLAYAEPSVGVKKGDWVEYTVKMTGQTSAPSKNMTWFRIEILGVEGAAFQANVTVRYVNGTFHSSVWKFNFTEGQCGGWLIIPSNLDAGNTFFDAAKPGNVTIEGEEQKIVAGASRTITHACDSKRIIKEWDKATGIYTYAVEHPKNFTIITNAIATNMWSPQILEVNQTVFYGLIAVSVVLAAGVMSLVVIVTKRKKSLKKPALHFLSQGKIAALTIIAVALFEVITILFFPFSSVGLSFAQLNLIMQTVWSVLVLGSMWFRMKGNYFVHEILMLIVMSAWAVGFVAVLFMDPFSSSTGIFSNTSLRLVMNSLHGIFSVPALILGVWLVALWRPESTSFAFKSRRIAQLMVPFWILSYVVGVLDFMVLHTAFFG